MWFAYLESQGLLKDDDPAAVDALFGAFPVQPLPFQAGEGEQRRKRASDAASKEPAPPRTRFPATIRRLE